MKKRLVILSVPFQRLIRVQLSTPTLSILRQQADLLIVSPFSSDPTFQQEFGGESIHFLQWNAPERIKQPFGLLFNISENLRTLGYYRRNRKKGMAYFLANINVQFGIDGNDKKLSVFHRFTFYVLSMIGVWPGAWKAIDWFIGPSVFNFPALMRLAKGYEQVTIIQSANWGIQDRMLAWMGRQENWRTVLVPYTTDQLYCNGYLISDFNAIGVQGTKEDSYARELHNLPASRIKHLGSVWFRHMELIKKQLLTEKDSEKGGVRKILYSGLSSQYFPRSSEYLGLEVLLDACLTGKIKNAHVIYRPLGETTEIKREIVERYQNTSKLTIQFAQQSCYGLAELMGGSNSTELVEYIGQLIEADILVMCLSTTLALDAALFGIPVVGNQMDPSKILAKRNTQLLLNKDGRFPIFTAIPVVNNQFDLVSAVNELLNSKEKAAAQTQQTVLQWDYPTVNFHDTLIETVFGESINTL